jgi:hypothetical protein
MRVSEAKSVAVVCEQDGDWLMKTHQAKSVKTTRRGREGVCGLESRVWGGRVTGDLLFGQIWQLSRSRTTAGHTNSVAKCGLGRCRDVRSRFEGKCSTFCRHKEPTSAMRNRERERESGREHKTSKKSAISRQICVCFLPKEHVTKATEMVRVEQGEPANRRFESESCEKSYCGKRPKQRRAKVQHTYNGRGEAEGKVERRLSLNTKGNGNGQNGGAVWNKMRLLYGNTEGTRGERERVRVRRRGKRDEKG